MFCAASVLGALLLSLSPSSATAQIFPFFDSCNCYRPVVQACYRTVPVTEYRQVRHTVQKPIFEKKYVDRTFTEYRPVTETKTAEVPTITYANVTENRTVYRDMGYWNVQQHCTPRVSPCAYDSRPNMIGWLNRTGYQIRLAFTPRVITTRRYVPNVVAQQIPITRRVAQRSVRHVKYTVTRMVPHTTTRKVAIDTVRYVSKEVVSTQPVTVMRTVPIGSRVAYSYLPYGAGSRTALMPQPDAIGGGSNRTVDRRNRKTPPKQFKRESSSFKLDSSRKDTDAQRLSHPIRQRQLDAIPPQASLSRPVPSAVRVGRWSARHGSPSTRISLAASVH